MRKSVVIVSLGIVAVGCAAVIAVPDFIQHKAIQAAAAQGIALHIGSTHLGIGGIRFENDDATTVRMPNAKAHIDEITTSWNVDSVVINGAEVTIDGPPQWAAAPATDNPVPNESSIPSHLASGHISWTHALGDAAIDVSGISGDYESSAKSGDSYKCSGNISLLVGGKTIGPFTTQYDTSRGVSNHIVVTTDPNDPSTESFVADFSPGFSNVDLQINARPVSKIGVPPDLLGIAGLGSDPVVSVHLTDHVDRTAPAAPKANGLVSFSIGAITVPGLSAPAPVAINLVWSGNPDTAMPVSGSRFSVGPFSGPITGTIMRPEGAAVANLSTETNAVPCATLSKNGPVGGGLMAQVLAQAGVKSDVVGDVKISGALQFDSRNPGGRRISLTPSSTCGLSISLGSDGK